jgi:hypothetical protein
MEWNDNFKVKTSKEFKEASALIIKSVCKNYRIISTNETFILISINKCKQQRNISPEEDSNSLDRYTGTAEPEGGSGSGGTCTPSTSGFLKVRKVPFFLD